MDKHDFFGALAGRKKGVVVGAIPEDLQVEEVQVEEDLNMKDEKSALLRSYTEPQNEAMFYKQKALAAIFAKYPYFFHKDISTSINIPVGWLKGLEQALDRFAATGLGILIYDICLRSSELHVKVIVDSNEDCIHETGLKYHVRAAQSLLDDLLRPVAETCMLCGQPRAVPAKEVFSRGDTGTKAKLCPQCQKVFTSQTKNSEKITTQCRIA